MLPGYRGGRGGFGGIGWWLSAYSLLLIAEKPRHGYEIASELRDLGFPIFGVGQMGAVYRTLASLEASGFITYEWDTSNSPPKKVYKITGIGREYLERIRQEILSMKRMIDKFVEKFEKIGG
ncbi:MAG: PadR family transcriptional regulator [Thermotogaceae bacterium]|nr:PadR family transcriptional regulator [Thermotogaceae bacterium]